MEGEQHQWIGGDAAWAAAGAIHLHAGSTLVLEAADITLRTPGGFVRINGRATRGSPKGSKIPDIVVTKDGNKPPTQDNLERVVEIKFEPDRLTPEQAKDYRRIAGDAPFVVLGPKKCGCPKDEPEKQPQPVPMEDVDFVEVGILALALLILVADDVVPGGQPDDVLIPAAVTRLLMKLAPLLGRTF